MTCGRSHEGGSPRRSGFLEAKQLALLSLKLIPSNQAVPLQTSQGANLVSVGSGCVRGRIGAARLR
jgi:hypothetical protein